MIEDFAERARRFQNLHHRPDLLVLPNPWDAGSARILENLGFSALASTSAGLAFSLGRCDGEGAVTADETFAHVRDLIAATRVPISADLENGFGVSPETVAATIRQAAEVGLSGASIEDASYDPAAPLYDRMLATERIAAAVEAARALPHPFVLTARAENFVRGRPDLDDALARLHAYDLAGADVLYAPGLPDAAAIRLACATTTKPFNYVAGIGSTRFTLAELAGLGVRRVTIGTSFVRCALGAFLRAAREVLEHGTFGYLEGLPTVTDVNHLIVTPSARAR
ncbi:MAG TPA: isocitrate lyase/phosphoenolpyruvate mutase family protein [Kofleriaceae bacterium]|jgi:2-methylisocitrate lyase-like PEP mutase family enzyme|nr:isocitrate lyase/phosphoenolpyruvate mutase family protein [Kofleriaceae bacterium]